MTEKPLPEDECTFFLAGSHHSQKTSEGCSKKVITLELRLWMSEIQWLCCNNSAFMPVAFVLLLSIDMGREQSAALFVLLLPSFLGISLFGIILTN